MVTIIKKGMKKKEIQSLLTRQKNTKKKKINLKKYCGVIELQEDALTLQKQWRNEWK
jgi:hypothetical protein